MCRRVLVSVIAAVVVSYAGTEALAAAISPPSLKIIATVVAHAHPDSTYIARY